MCSAKRVAVFPIIPYSLSVSSFHNLYAIVIDLNIKIKFYSSIRSYLHYLFRYAPQAVQEHIFYKDIKNLKDKCLDHVMF